MGVDRQPDCITGLVLRTKDVELTAAVVVACRILGRLFPTVPMTVTTDRIVAGTEEWAEEATHALVSNINSMYVPWSDLDYNKLRRTLHVPFEGEPVNLRPRDHNQATPEQAATRMLELVI